MVESVLLLQELNTVDHGLLVLVCPGHRTKPHAVRTHIRDLDGQELLLDDPLCFLLHLLAKLSCSLVDLEAQK